MCLKPAPRPNLPQKLILTDIRFLERPNAADPGISPVATQPSEIPRLDSVEVEVGDSIVGTAAQDNPQQGEAMPP